MGLCPGALLVDDGSPKNGTARHPLKTELAAARPAGQQRGLPITSSLQPIPLFFVCLVVLLFNSLLSCTPLSSSFICGDLPLCRP